MSAQPDNPSSPLCQGPQGEPELGGFWGWVEFDRSGTQTWGDAQLTGCGHTPGGGGPGSAGAGHESVATTTDDPDFLSDSGIPAEPGHYAFHPAPGVSGNVQVAFRPAA